MHSRLLFASLLLAASVAFAQTTTRSGAFRNLGPQITATTIQGASFTRDSSGKLLVCAVVRGLPAKLAVFSIDNPKPVHVIPLANEEGSWKACTAADDSVYIGTDPKGHLFRYIPGTSTVHDLGKGPTRETWIWDVTPGDDDAVIFSTYPGCRLVRYQPKDGFKEISNGPLVHNENYARSVAYDAKRNLVYGGVGSHAHLIQIDLKTGKKTDLLPADLRDQEMVYGMQFLGDRLYAVVTNKRVCLVYNATTGHFEPSLKNMPAQLVMTKSPRDERVFFVRDGMLCSYDPTTPHVKPKELIKCPDAGAFAWEGDELVIFTRSGQIVRYDPAANKKSTLALDPPAEPVQIQSISLGPDGKMWMGGYLSGGNAAYDPRTNESHEYKGLSQSESIASLGHSLYFGLYPHGRFATYDTTRPWDINTNNPRIIGKLDEQSRPFAGIGVPPLNKVFFGLVPEYGLLGGGLASYDPAIDKLDFQRNLIPNQSIVSLVWTNNLLVGGSSIYGGLGIDPSEKEAKLFIYDPTTRQKIFEIAPVPGAQSVTGLAIGPGKNVWGVAEGVLFVFDVANRKILSTHPLMKTSYPERHVWRDAFLILHPNGQIYGTLQYKFFRLDPHTFQMTILRNEHTELLAMDRDGRLYFRDKVNLWQYSP